MSIRLIALASLALLVSTPGYACEVSMTPMTFGIYIPSDTQAMPATATIDIMCQVGVKYKLRASESLGMKGFEPRYLQHIESKSRVAYNIFLDPVGQDVWGDGRPGTKVIRGKGTGSGTSYFVYGVVFPNQRVNAGAYSDSINIIVEW